MDKAHLIAKRTLRAHLLSTRELRQTWAKTDLWDERLWVPACRFHHANWDNYRFDVPRSALSPELEALAEDLGLGPALDRRFGPVAKTTIAEGSSV